MTAILICADIFWLLNSRPLKHMILNPAIETTPPSGVLQR